ncbi:MAG: VIT domain-containing protein [Planctomycetes bacterium]|nr:VIT domain-containing protein [Planctomycetota bacterium]
MPKPGCTLFVILTSILYGLCLLPNLFAEDQRDYGAKETEPALIDQGRAKLALEDFRGALDLFQRALAEDAANLDAKFFVAFTREQMLAGLRQSQRTNATKAVIHGYLEYLLALEGVSSEEWVASYVEPADRALRKLDPVYAEARNTHKAFVAASLELAKLAADGGRPVVAQKLLRRVFELSPGNPQAIELARRVNLPAEEIAAQEASEYSETITSPNVFRSFDYASESPVADGSGGAIGGAGGSFGARGGRQTLRARGGGGAAAPSAPPAISPAPNPQPMTGTPMPQQNQAGSTPSGSGSTSTPPAASAPTLTRPPAPGNTSVPTAEETAGAPQIIGEIRRVQRIPLQNAETENAGAERREAGLRRDRAADTDDALDEPADELVIVARDNDPLAEPDPKSGQMFARDADGRTIGEFPLKHTEVTAKLSGPLAAVDVTQTFGNDFEFPVEAVYVFPLPADAAVGEFIMTVGGRKVRGIIRERAEAERLYAEARARGLTASLLTQERPNIFTQNVANIPSGESVDVSVRYVNTLRYENHQYEWRFPMVVAPRFIPGGNVPMPTPVTTQDETNPVGGGGTIPANPVVPDADRITPPVLPEGMRSGHDIHVTVEIDAGLPITGIECGSHLVDVAKDGNAKASINLREEDHIANRDFVLSYKLAGEAPEVTLLTSHSDAGDFFLVIAEPPARTKPFQILPREYFFIVDVSGSQQGFPLDTSKRFMRRALQDLRPDDTFQIVQFAEFTEVMNPEGALPATRENLETGLRFTARLVAGGGTQLQHGMLEALHQQQDPERMRVVCFITDALIGQEEQVMQIIDSNRGDARICSVGVGGSTNTALIEKIAEMGLGFSTYIPNHADPEQAVTNFFGRMRAPLLMNIEISAEGGEVRNIYPNPVRDLYDGQPISLLGSWSGGETGTIVIKAIGPEGAFEKRIPVDFSDGSADRRAVTYIWARQRIEDMMTNLHTSTDQAERERLQETVKDFALEFGLMSPFTAFIAIDEEGDAQSQPSTRIDQPLEMPEGMSREGTLGQPGQGEIRLDATRRIGATFEQQRDGTVVCTGVAQDSSAERGGLQVGDVIERAEGERIENVSDLRDAINNLPEGDAHTFRVRRGRSQRNVEIVPQD